jgi:hypothetical protein
VTRVSVLALVVLCALAAAPSLAAPADAAGTDAATLRERRAALTAKSAALSKEDVAKERYALGLWARDRNLPDEARAEFQAAVAADPSHEPAHAALGDVKLGDRWIAHDEAMAAKGLVLRGGTWILREEAEVLDQPATEKARRREEHAKVEKLLRTYAAGNDTQRKFAVQTLGTVDDRYKVEPFAYALRAKSDAVRVLAASELGRLGNRRALGALVKRAVLDPSQAVREASVDAAKAIGDANLAAPFVRALDSGSPDVRKNAVAAIERVGDVRGVKYLIWKLEAHGGTGQRVFSFFGNQLTYIQDFDVEVAQTAFIADPIVGVLQEGIVLDVQINALDREMVWAERELIHGAIGRMTGATGVKNVPGGWIAWWKEKGEDWEKNAIASK